MKWISSSDLKKLHGIDSRNYFAKKCSHLSVDDIAKKYSYLGLSEMNDFLRCILLKELKIDLTGVGVELGCGVGTVSNTILKIYPKIEKIYQIEVVPNIVRLLTKKTNRHYNNCNRLIPVIGSFDKMKLQDNSIDFAIEFDSLHHSTNLTASIKEVRRVLKPNGMLIFLDRMHSNYLSKKQKKFMLSVEYSQEFKKKNDLQLEKKMENLNLVKMIG